MKVGIMQPYFMPYIGYFQLMNVVDTYVVYDDVNHIKRGWINRNRILIGRQPKLFTISLFGASSQKLINEIDIADDFVKLRKTLQINYSKAPFKSDVMNLMERIFAFPDKNVAIFMANSFQVIFEYLGLSVNLMLSSEIKKNNGLKGQDKVLEICKRLNADIYINAIGGMDLYDKEKFGLAGISLKFLKSGITPYHQFENTFAANLSMIDVLMFNSKEKINHMLGEYEFV